MKASFQTSATLASQVREPHIKRELQKTGHATRSRWNKRRRRVPVVPYGAQRPDDGEQRSRAPHVSEDRPAPDTSRSNSFINSALPLPSERHPAGFRRRRSVVSWQNAATPNETIVKISEWDKASLHKAFLHSTLTPGSPVQSRISNSVTVHCSPRQLCPSTRCRR